MASLLGKNSFPLGLDISDVSLKVIQFASQGGKFGIAGFSDKAFSKDVLQGDKIKNPQLLIEVIKAALAAPKFGRFSGRNVVASIPETKSFVRVIQMPAMSEEEAAEAVPWEAEAYIPLPISQVYLDWVILDGLPASGSAKKVLQNGAKMTVLITASPKDYINDLVSVLKAADLKPLALEVESQATARSLVAQKNEIVLIADIDTVRTSLIVVDKGTLQFTSSLPVAGDLFTEKIAKSLELSTADAENLKREVGIEDDKKRGLVKKALLPVLNNLVEEIKNTIRFYEEHAEAEEKIERLLLSGGSSKLKHLPSFLHDRLTHQEDESHQLRSLPGIKVELGNPWVNVLRKGQTPPLSREDSLSYGTAIGLALREIE